MTPLDLLKTVVPLVTKGDGRRTKLLVVLAVSASLAVSLAWYYVAAILSEKGKQAATAAPNPQDQAAIQQKVTVRGAIDASGNSQVVAGQIVGHSDGPVSQEAETSGIKASEKSSVSVGTITP